MVTSPSLINEKQHFIKFSTAGYIPYLVNEKHEILVIKPFLHLKKKFFSTSGYIPYPGGGEKWGGNGVGDDLYSYGFDGEALSS